MIKNDKILITAKLKKIFHAMFFNLFVSRSFTPRFRIGWESNETYDKGNGQWFDKKEIVRSYAEIASQLHKDIDYWIEEG